VADSTIFGVNTSVKSRPSSAERNPAALADAIVKPARSRGWRSVPGAWSRIVGSVAVRAGRYRSNGGGAAGPDSAVTAGSVSSAPPGACGQVAGRSGRQHDLGQAGPVADDEERHRFQVAAAVQPAGDSDAAAEALTQVGGQYS
jgi:hypothetical protein